MFSVCSGSCLAAFLYITDMQMIKKKGEYLAHTAHSFSTVFSVDFQSLHWVIKDNKKVTILTPTMGYP